MNRSSSSLVGPLPVRLERRCVATRPSYDAAGPHGDRGSPGTVSSVYPCAFDEVVRCERSVVDLDGHG
jgi:hypothetical protein